MSHNLNQCHNQCAAFCCCSKRTSRFVRISSRSIEAENSRRWRGDSNNVALDYHFQSTSFDFLHGTRHDLLISHWQFDDKTTVLPQPLILSRSNAAVGDTARDLQLLELLQPTKNNTIQSFMIMCQTSRYHILFCVLTTTHNLLLVCICTVRHVYGMSQRILLLLFVCFYLSDK